MCRRSVLCGAALAAAGAGLIIAVLIDTGVLSVLLGIALILCGVMVGRVR